MEAVSIPILPMRVNRDQSLVDSVPEELKAGIRDGVSACFDQTADRFPPGTYLVPLGQIRQGVTKGRANWPSVAARFGGVHMWFAFSRALVTMDRRDAVVFYERQCDGLCGEAEWVWFHRDRLDEAWRITKEVWNWIS